MLLPFAVAALGATFRVTTAGHASFRLEYNDSIEFAQSGTESFLIFDTDISNSLVLAYANKTVAVPDPPAYALAVSDSPTLRFRKHLPTAVSIFTLPVGRCGRDSRSVTGVSSLNFTIGAAAAIDFCLFPVATVYAESVRLAPPGVSAFFVLNGTDEVRTNASLLSARAPFYIRARGEALSLARAHSGAPEVNWNLCQATGFVFVSGAGAERPAPAGDQEIRCFLSDFDAPPPDARDIAVAAAVLFVTGALVPVAVEVPPGRRLIRRLFPRRCRSDGSLTYDTLGDSPAAPAPPQ
jgi:hypothetical protein